jgi:hypothetical protein
MLQGNAIGADGGEYEAARRLWNCCIDRRPAAIARPRSASEVAAILRAAREAGREVTVRCGGHSPPGRSVADGAVLIDLSLMREVSVDPEARTARVGGPALWANLDGATAPLGLATTGGMISYTGVGGLTLGGGIGHLMRKHGLAIDNLLSAEVVLADGRAVRASQRENPDLFWALRGGGGNFGIVTQFEFRLHPVKNVLGGMVLYPASHARPTLGFFREFTAGAPDELTTLLVFLTAPPAPFIPPHLQGTPMVAIAACWCGPLARGAEVLQPLRSLGPPAVDLLAEMPYVALQSMFDPSAPHGLRYYMKSVYFEDLSYRVVEAIADGATPMPSPLSQVHLHHFGGAVSRVPAEATAYANRGARYALNIIPAWTEPAADAA